jgi:hypothetical protein
LAWNVKSTKNTSVKLAGSGTKNLKSLSKNESIKNLTTADFITQYGPALWDWIFKANDSSKNERHGDSGRTMEKAQKQIAELEKQLENAKN